VGERPTHSSKGFARPSSAGGLEQLCRQRPVLLDLRRLPIGPEELRLLGVAVFQRHTGTRLPHRARGTRPWRERRSSRALRTGASPPTRRPRLDHEHAQRADARRGLDKDAVAADEAKLATDKSALKSDSQQEQADKKQRRKDRHELRKDERADRREDRKERREQRHEARHGGH
jgi:hypothetical protein